MSSAHNPWPAAKRIAEMNKEKRTLLSQEMLNDLPGGGAPGTGMRADVFERGIQRADPMRLAGSEGMDGNGHEAGDRLTLTVHSVELTLQHRFEFGNHTFVSK